MIYHYIQQVCVDTLKVQLADFAVIGINVIGDDVYIEIENALTNEQKISLDSIMGSHNIGLIRLYQAKQRKNNELREACNAFIFNGFNSNVKNGDQYYKYDYEDQINMNCIMTNIVTSQNYEVYWRNSDQIYPEAWTHEEFIALNNAGLEHKKAACLKFYGLRQNVNDCVSISDVELIKWV